MSNPFREELRQRLEAWEYTRWAAGLSSDQIEVVLWAAGEFGLRTPPAAAARLVMAQDPHCRVAARVALGLQVISRFVHGQPVSHKETRELLEAALQLPGSPS